ncbi:MAG: SAM-dependent methyltransferase [Solirubrobacterales bacterium]|jgi:SAM-dependent methyltransferase|nr:SAM-dependent methyltransferase [Solirubrobacterales bacterium]
MSALTGAKRALARPYRGVQRRLERLVFEPGLEDTNAEPPGRAASGFLFLRRGLRGCRVGPEDVLLDYGSGKGRVLLQAARYPFARVIGLELDDSLGDVARRNLERARGRVRAGSVEIVTADATTWQVPDDVTYVYMFNPFGGDVFRATIARLVESLDRRPRRLTLIYANPRWAPEILATGRFERVRVSRWPRPDIHLQRIEIFRAAA